MTKSGRKSQQDHLPGSRTWRPGSSSIAWRPHFAWGPHRTSPGPCREATEHREKWISWSVREEANLTKQRGRTYDAYHAQAGTNLQQGDLGSGSRTLDQGQKERKKLLAHPLQYIWTPHTDRTFVCYIRPPTCSQAEDNLRPGSSPGSRPGHRTG
jgi:hypothetical protein